MYADLLTSEKIAFRTIDQFVNEPSAYLDREHVISKLRNVVEEFNAWFCYHPLRNGDVMRDDDWRVMGDRLRVWQSCLWLFKRGREQEALHDARANVGA